MAIMEISIVPIGTGTTSVSKYVANALKVLKDKEGIKYQLTAMGTIVEAESLDTLLNLAKEMHQSAFDSGAVRVLTNIKIDDRTDKKLSIKGKIKSVEDVLGNL